MSVLCQTPPKSFQDSAREFDVMLPQCKVCMKSSQMDPIRSQRNLAEFPGAPRE